MVLLVVAWIIYYIFMKEKVFGESKEWSEWFWIYFISFSIAVINVGASAGFLAGSMFTATSHAYLLCWLNGPIYLII